jgi:hypothetical protein
LVQFLCDCCFDRYSAPLGTSRFITEKLITPAKRTVLPKGVETR